MFSFCSLRQVQRIRCFPMAGGVSGGQRGVRSIMHGNGRIRDYEHAHPVTFEIDDPREVHGTRVSGIVPLPTGGLREDPAATNTARLNLATSAVFTRSWTTRGTGFLGCIRCEIV